MRVLISGYYGFGNAGDEAVLSGLLHALAPHGVEPVVISGDPGQTRALHGVAAVGRGEWGRIVRELRRAGLFVSGGGGLIQDRTSRRSALYYLGLIGLAQRMGVQTYLYAQGVGPVTTTCVRAAARIVLPGVAGAGARDRASARALTGLGVRSERVHVTADAAFALPPVTAQERAEALRAAGVGPEGPLVGVVWRPPAGAGRRGGPAAGREPGSSLAGALAAAAGRWAAETGASLVIVPMHPAFDLRESDRIAGRLREAGRPVHVLNRARDFRAIRAILSGLDLVVSVRYHALLFAAAAGVPCVGLAYDPKVESLGAEFGFETLPVEADSAELYGAMERAWSRRAAFSESALDRAHELRRRAEGEAARCAAIARGEKA